MEYPKINSLWKRGEDHSFIIGDYSCQEFPNIKRWSIDEKIDGTNIRLFFKQVDGERCNPSIMGRTDAASIPKFLLDHLQTIATWENFDKAFKLNARSFEVYIFGEGYGPKIQKAGSLYSDSVGFVLFDVMISDMVMDLCLNKHWFQRETLEKISYEMGIPIVPSLGTFEEDEIVELVKSKPLSFFSKKEQVLEGIVARTEPMILFSCGNPIKWKLKCRDFEEIK